MTFIMIHTHLVDWYITDSSHRDEWFMFDIRNSVNINRHVTMKVACDTSGLVPRSKCSVKQFLSYSAGVFASLELGWCAEHVKTAMYWRKYLYYIFWDVVWVTWYVHTTVILLSENQCFSLHMCSIYRSRAGSIYIKGSECGLHCACGCLGAIRRQAICRHSTGHLRNILSQCSCKPFI